MPLMMNQIIPNGTKLKTLAGEDVTVLGVISTSGGQGDVYRVEWKNGEYALKWYNKNAADVVGSEQYHTILKLTKKRIRLRKCLSGRRQWSRRQALTAETGKSCSDTR